MAEAFEEDRAAAYVQQKRIDADADLRNWMTNSGDTKASPTAPPAPDPNDRFGISLGSVAKDIGTGVVESPHAIVGGIVDASRNTLLAGASLADWITGNADSKSTEGNLSFQEALDTVLPKMDEEKSNTGKFVRGTSQFLTGFIPALKGVRMAAGGAAVSRLGSFAQAETAAAAASALVMDPHEARLSNFLSEHTEVTKPVWDYLKASPEDGEAEGRFKNALEGLGFGALTEGFMGGVRLIRAKRIENGSTIEERNLAQGDKPVYVSSLGQADTTATNKTNFLTQAGIVKITNGSRDAASLVDDMNWDSFDGSRSVEKAVKAIAGIRDTGANPAEVGRAATITDDSVVKIADQIGWSPESFIAMQTAMNKGKVPSVERMNALFTVMDGATLKLQDTARKASTSTDDGNLLDFLRMVNVRTSVQLWARGATQAATRSLKGFEMPTGSADKQFAEIAEYLTKAGGNNKVRELATAVSQINDPSLLNKALSRSEGTAVGNLVESYWYFAMLSGMKTQVVNMASTAGNMLWQIPERALAAQISKVRGSANGVTDQEAGAMFRGMIAALTDGIRVGSRPNPAGISAIAAAKKTWKTNVVDDPLVRGIRPELSAVSAAKFGFNGPPGTASWVTGKAIDGLGWALNLPTRALSTADSFNRAIARSGELHAQAYRSAMNDDNLTGRHLAARVEELLANPTKDMMQKAVDFSRDAVLAAPLNSWDKNILENINAHPIAKVVVPFYRISANMLRWVGKRTPLAIASKGIRDDIRRGGAEGDLALARMAMGSMVGLVMANQVWEGNVTGGGPTDPNLNKVWKVNNQPFSFKIGNEWYSYSRADPMGALMGAAASYAEIAGQLTDEDADEIVKAISVATAKSVFSKNYVGDVGEFLDAMRGEKGAGTVWLKKKVGSLVPAAVSQVTQEVDPVWREVDGIIDSIKAKLPGFSSTLPPHRNLWGEPIHLEGGLGPDIVSPVYTQTVGKDPVSDYIVDNKLAIGMPTKTQENVELTPKEYSRFVELAGNAAKNPATGKGAKETLDEMFAGKGPLAAEWQRGLDGPDGRRAYIIEKVIRDYRDVAWQKLKQENPDLQKRVMDAMLDKQEAMGTRSNGGMPTLGR